MNIQMYDIIISFIVPALCKEIFQLGVIAGTHLTLELITEELFSILRMVMKLMIQSSAKR